MSGTPPVPRDSEHTESREHLEDALGASAPISIIGTNAATAPFPTCWL
ncbi:hypothetical protein [Streptomyces lutosisoli]|uniref:Uncharacterized protein n=1 Tax=Streptomyces lutosisoli TaxID=2665721 RepID=A0ABW2VW13_9ACTN